MERMRVTTAAQDTGLDEAWLEDSAPDETCTAGHGQYSRHKPPCHNEAVFRAFFEEPECHPVLVCTVHVLFYESKPPDTSYVCSDCLSRVGLLTGMKPIR